MKLEVFNLDDEIYDLEYAEELLDDDEISAEEQAFMMGHDEATNGKE